MIRKPICVSEAARPVACLKKSAPETSVGYNESNAKMVTMLEVSEGEKATFAGGCFWGVEDAFAKTDGVIDAVSGYTGGHTESPTYEQVSSGNTGHAEAVEVRFDPAKVSYETLVRRFFKIHDPTQMNRQGPDVGEQYRSVIFYHSPKQQEIAERIKKDLAPQYYPKTIATSIEPAKTFWRAEEYHQDFAVKNPQFACHI